MIFLNRWKFFSNRGNDLNLIKIENIVVEISDSTGKNAKFLALTDSSNNLTYIEIVSSGLGYTSPTITITDLDTNETHEILPGDITLDPTTFGVASVVLGTPTIGAWSYPSFYYEGEMFLPEKVSVNLIDNEHIFVIEEIKDTDPTKDLGYVYPRTDSAAGAIRWQWEDAEIDKGDDEAFFLFDVDTTSSLTPFINKVDNSDFSIDNGTGDAITPGPKYWRNIPDVNDSSIQVNIGFSYKEEGVFRKILELYDYTNTSTPALLARIAISGEVVPEDERFTTILDNLGQQINAEEEFIFRESDINEALPDYKLLNEKRKEFILEHANIISYIGSYKGLFNVINWLGYNDLRIKEYYLNVAEGTPNFGKKKPFEIPFDLAQRGADYKSIDLLPSNKYKKTSLFGLFYDINKESGEIDQFGIPEVEDSFMFTIEEVLIKLFALKNYLKNKFLPFNARIIDIIGEGVYFERYRNNTWTDGTRVFDVDLTREAKIECEPKDAQVIDLRILEDYNFFQAATVKSVVDVSTKQIVGVVVTDPGFGYVGPITVELIGGTPTTPATATATIDAQGSVSITGFTGGAGYTSAPMVKITPEPTNPNPVTNLIDIYNRPIGFFDAINDTNLFPDEPGISVGAPVTLKTSTFDITWDDIQYPWDSFYYDFRPATAEAIINGIGEVTGFNIIDPGSGYTSVPTINLLGGSPTTPASIQATVANGEIISLLPVAPNFGGLGYNTIPTVDFIGGIPVSVLNTWDTIGIGDFYEMEWIVNGPRSFQYRKRGRVDELRELVVILPFVGDYDVEIILYDTDNNWTNLIEKKCINVSLPNVEFTTFGRFGQCYTNWDDLDMTWDEANYMWIHPIKHDVKWDDLDLTWDDLDMASYTNQRADLFPVILEKPISRLTETDRFLGNLSDVNLITNTIQVNDPVTQPRAESGDFLYFRQDDTTFRTQIINSSYTYSLNSAPVTVPGTYSIQKDFSTGSLANVTPGSWGANTPVEKPIIVFTPPISGTTAEGSVTLDATIVDAPLGTNASGNTGYINAYNPITNALVPGGPISISPSFLPAGVDLYKVVFSEPEDPSGVTAEGYIAIVLPQGEFGGWYNSDGSLALTGPEVLGSGYSFPPSSFTITDNVGNVVNNLLAEDDILFNITIQGGISEIVLTNIGSGYVTPPTGTIYPDGGGGIINPILSSASDVGTFIMDAIPSSVNNSWDILREIGRTVKTPGNCIYEPTLNPSGIKKGDWLKLRGEDNIPKIKRIPITTDIFDSFSILSGINLPSDRTDFIVGEKCSIYRVRNINFGVGSNPGDFVVDSVNNQIVIVDPLNAVPAFDPSIEIEPGYHEILLKNWNPVSLIFDYIQRVSVIHVNKVGNDFVLDVEPLDGDLSLFVNNTLSEIEYQFFEFPAVIDETILVGSDTDIILNLNDWPAHDTFNPSVDTWYIDYGVVSGDWSLLVTDIGLEGTDTLIQLDDPNSELWRSSTSYLLGWRQFDEDYAERRYGTDTQTWENLDEVTWDDLCHLTWDMLDYQGHSYCGFRIDKVGPSGRIQWNEESVFEFQGITGAMTTVQKLNQAVLELNATDNTGLSRFGYTAMPDSTNPTYIMATSYTAGGDALGYLRFTNGCEGEYSSDPTLSHTFPLNNTDNPVWLSGFYGPNNKPANWDSTIRAYNEWGVDPASNTGWYPSQNLPMVYKSTQETWRSDRIPYLRAVGGPFTWSETYVSSRNSKVPIYTTMFFTPSNCSIAGKSKYLWKVYNSVTNDVIMESIKPYLIWTFTEIGEFSVELTITDSNDNVKDVLRKGFIETYKSSTI